MSAPEQNVATRIALILRRYGWIVVLTTLATTLLALQFGPGPNRESQYEASAVVVATNLAIRPEGLPRFAQAVFDAGSVAERGRLIGSIPYPASELIPDHVRLEPFENTVALQVTGTDPDPDVAARLANSLAIAFVDELNKAGPGVGTFAVQDTARRPTQPIQDAPIPIVVVVAAVAGVLLGVGIVALFAAVRQPVLTAQEAAAAAGVPVLANLQASPRSDRRSTPTGVAAVARALFPQGRGLGAVVAVPGGERTCSELAVRTAKVLAARGPTYLVEAEGTDLGADMPTLIASPLVPPEETAAAAPVLVDQPTEIDLLHLAPAGARMVLVAVSGSPASAISRAAGHFLPGELDGVAFVQRRPRLLEVFLRKSPVGPEARAARARALEDERRRQMQQDLLGLQQEIDRAGTTLRVMIREAAELRKTAHIELEAELRERREQLLKEARRTVDPSPPAAPAQPAPPSNAGRPAPDRIAGPTPQQPQPQPQEPTGAGRREPSAASPPRAPQDPIGAGRREGTTGAAQPVPSRTGGPAPQPQRPQPRQPHDPNGAGRREAAPEPGQAAPGGTARPAPQPQPQPNDATAPGRREAAPGTQPRSQQDPGGADSREAPQRPTSQPRPQQEAPGGGREGSAPQVPSRREPTG